MSTENSERKSSKMLKDYFLLAFRNLSRRKLRSFLTILGIFIGIAAVVALISLGQGLQTTINEQFRKIGSDKIIITAGGITMGPFGSPLTVEKLTDKDIKAVKSVSGVKLAVALITETARVDFKDETEHIQIFGTPNDAESINELKKIGLFEIDSGREFQSSDTHKVIVAYNVAHNLFNKEITTKDKIKINNKEFDVVGVQKKIGTGIHDAIIRIPRDTAKEIFNTEEYSMIVAVVKEGENVKSITEEIKKELRKSRGVKENKEDFSVQAAAQMIERLSMILNLVQIFLIAIAAISLIVGGIGIMNTMYTSVLERTREIGIMKAIGAKNSEIMLIFLIESGMLGLIGGIIGVGIGLMLSKTAEIIAMQFGFVMLKAYFGAWLIFFALAFSFFIGCIAGISPAREASKLNPVEAIRRYK